MDSSFCARGVSWKRERKKSWRINDFQSEWICQKPSALFTLLLSAHGEPEPLGLPAQGETGHSGSPLCTSGSQLEVGGGAIFCVVEPLGRCGWYTETPAQHNSDQWTICCCRKRGRKVGKPPGLSVSVRTLRGFVLNVSACVDMWIKCGKEQLKPIMCLVFMLFRHMHSCFWAYTKAKTNVCTCTSYALKLKTLGLGLKICFSTLFERNKSHSDEAKRKR